MLVFMAIIVAAMLLAFYLPMFEAIGDVEQAGLMAAQDLTTPAAARPAAEEEAARALALRYGLEYVDVGSFAPDPEILQSVPVDLMFRYNFLPYRRDENGRLVLVMADPTDIPVVDELACCCRRHPARGGHACPRSRRRSRADQGTQRVLEQAAESFKIQIVREDEAGEEFLSIDKIQADAVARSSASSTPRSSTPSPAAPPTSTSRPATPRSSSSTASTACSSRP